MAVAPKPRRKRRQDPRRPAHLRGYDATWHRLARDYRRQHPLCEHCLAAGRTRPAKLVDHVQAITGPHDPLRLAWSNLQSLCRRCHAIKTAHESRGR